jgi:hypothetical protein
VTVIVLAPVVELAVFAVKLASPPYVKVITSLPSGNVGAEYVAFPFVRVAVPNRTPLFKKLTSPVGVPLVVEATFAVRVTL